VRPTTVGYAQIEGHDGRASDILFFPGTSREPAAPRPKVTAVATASFDDLDDEAIASIAVLKVNGGG
jgi:hypothetical protein